LRGASKEQRAPDISPLDWPMEETFLSPPLCAVQLQIQNWTSKSIYQVATSESLKWIGMLKKVMLQVCVFLISLNCISFQENFQLKFAL
jgi:hypothetical protein